MCDSDHYADDPLAFHVSSSSLSYITKMYFRNFHFNKMSAVDSYVINDYVFIIFDIILLCQINLVNF